MCIVDEHEEELKQELYEYAKSARLLKHGARNRVRHSATAKHQ